MGHKKRNVAPRSKQPPPGVASSVGATLGGGALSSNEANGQNLDSIPPIQERSKTEVLLESDALSYSAIKLECERALTALRRGNHTKALRLMKEMCVKHENSALIHRVQGTVCVKVASIIDDPNVKNRHLKNAIESARKAVELSPRSIEFAHFYANLLYEAANEGKEYDEVVHECERALAVEHPVDPAKESLQDESQQKISTAEGRISHMQAELRSLIQKSNIASISTWMKNFGNGEEKFRLIPIRRAAEDPMELRLAQARRPNEIKKVTKTPEERRKEIEVRVAAARLLQRTSESPQVKNDGDKGSESSLGSGQRVNERRKSGNARKNASSAERKDWVRSYWNSMRLDMKKDLLRVNISDLKAHFNMSKDGPANEVLLEALSFAEANKVWKFWMCCRCNKKFVVSELVTQHVVQEHMDNLLPKLQSVLPQNVENEWIDMLLNWSWRPLDASAAVRMLEKQSKSQVTEFADDRFMRSDMEDNNNCFVDSYCSEYASDLSPWKKKMGDNCNGGSVESKEYDKIPDVAWRVCDDSQGSKGYFLPDNWPLSDDIERAKLLEKIHALFKLLIRHKFLAACHLSKVIQFAVDELQGIAYGSQLLSFGVDQGPLCICFLGASELKKIVKFLQELSHSCGLDRYADKDTCLDDSSTVAQVVEITEKVIVDEVASCLLLDEHCLPCNITSTSYHHAVAGDDTAANTNIDTLSGSGSLFDADSFLSWIFSGQTSGEHLASWTQMREDKVRQGMDILQMLEKEFDHLQSLCERKCEHLSYEEALQGVEDLCLEEGKKRESVTEFVHRSYESVLRKRRQELIESDNDVMFISHKFELDAISNVLKEAESLNVSQFGFDETYGGVASHLCDLESGEDDEWKTKDYLQQVDSCIEVAIQRQKDQFSVELSKIDARIMKNVSEMQQLESKLEHASSHDYQSVVVPLMKSFMRAHLEDLAEKDAAEKSDAAREAFLAELALDTKKGSFGGNDNSRQSNDKTKDKKKNKEYRKTKDSKAGGSNELHRLYSENADEILFPVACDGEHLDTAIVVAGSHNALNEEEEELRRRMELEAEERKLEETLEYQRRIEDEAKQKHLAELHRKSAIAIPEKMEAAGLHDSYSKCNDGDLVLHENSKCYEQEPLKQRDGYPDMLDIPKTADGAVGWAGCTHGHYQAKVKQGLANGVTPEDSLLSSERRTGRKGKRHKNSAKSIEGVPQPSQNENIDAGQVKHKDSSLDNETKTLRQLQVEDDDEERFQADLKKAVRQSLDTYHARQKLPPISNSRVPEKMLLETGESGVSSNEGVMENGNGLDVYGTGLKNEVGEYNCFLNVIIQSLWHLRLFRDEFLRRSTSEHVHVGDPCVICALYDIFIALNMPSETRREAVAPTSLRVALSNLYPDSNFFQEAQMNDASEVLGVIFDCLHRSFTSGNGVSDTESVESTCMGSWDCANSACVAHSLFGMDIFERMNCYNCSLESRHLKYTSFFHNINASALRTMKVMCQENSFDELLNLVEMNHQLACDPDAGGCGKLNYVHHILSTLPHVFTIVLGWQNTCESADDIKTTLSALATEIDIGILYRGLDPKNSHCLVSVVCYYGQHYHCFAYSHDHEQWLMYDDKTVKVIGDWDDVLTMCEKGHLQPQVLFFEAVN